MFATALSYPSYFTSGISKLKIIIPPMALFEHLDIFLLSYKQKNKFLSKEGAMKRIIMLAMILVMLVSIGGCPPVVREDDRNGEYDRDRGYKTFDGHDTRNTIMKNI
jgi:hypothetical protein